MNQPRPARYQFRHSSFEFRHSFVIRISSFVILLLTSCNKQTAAPTTQPTSPTIASTVPAATDLIIGMGAKDRLVAVSTYDKDRPDVGGYPKAGDYETIDWEVLRSLHPAVLVSQIAADRQNAGFKANAGELHILPMNVTIETLDDIYKVIDELAGAIKVPDLAITAKQQMHARINGVRQRVAGQKPVRTLIVIDTDANYIVGPGGYLDDLLTIAGGENAANSLTMHWPQVDREMLLSFKPDAIIQLMPNATAQERDKAAAVWKQLPQIPAVAAGRVYPIYEAYALLPGWHVTDLAEAFARCLHPVK